MDESPSEKKKNLEIIIVLIVSIFTFFGMCYYKGIGEAIDTTLIMSSLLFIFLTLTQIIMFIFSLVFKELNFEKKKLIPYSILALILIILNFINFENILIGVILKEYWIIYIIWFIYLLFMIIIPIINKRKIKK